MLKVKAVKSSFDLKTLSRATDAGIVAALTKGASHILTESNKVVPHEEGTLQRSGTTDVDRNAKQASVYYDTPYAVEQHENMHWKHDKGRTAKYLENTVNSQGDRVLDFIASELRKAF